MVIVRKPHQKPIAPPSLILIAIMAPAVAGDVPRQSPAPVIGSPTAGVREASEPLGQEQDLLVHPALKLVEIHPTSDERQRIERLTPHTAGPFDEAKYGFNFVDAYFDRKLAPEDERSDFTADGILRLVLAMRTPNGARRFWRLEPAGDNPDPGSVLGMDPLAITDEPDEYERIVTATDDPSVPVLDIRYSASRFGANTGVSFERHLLLDLRQRTPRAIALLDTVETGGGGACGAYNLMFGTRREFGCQWMSARGDFRCAETLHRYDTDWTERRGSRFFLLDSGETLPYPADGPRTLRAFVENAVRSRQGRTEMLEPYGAATIIETLSFGTATVVLVGTPLLTEEHVEFFGIRFHAGIVRPGSPTITEEVVPRARLEASAPTHVDLAHMQRLAARQKPSERFVPDGTPPEFRSRLLFETDYQKVLHVTVTEGEGRGVYLLGLEYVDARLTADALLVATEAPSYSGCNAWMLPTTAVAMDIGTNPFTALVDVEPAQLETLDRESDDWIISPQTDPRCPSKVQVTWRSGTGFELQQQPITCGAPRTPRRVRIDRDGRLTSSTSRLIRRPGR